MGLGVIASDYGGNSWQVRDGVSGLLYKARDVSELRERIERLMDDPILREQGGVEKRRRGDEGAETGTFKGGA